MRFTALTLSGLALILFACSSEAPSGSVKGGSTPAARDDADDDDKTQAPRSGNTNTGTDTSTNPTEPAPAGGQCGSQAKAEACFDCCDPSQNAFDAADQAFGDCICGAAKCGTQCAQTFCNAANPSEPQQGDACDTCLAQHYEGCDQAAADVCEKDANCKKAGECVEAAKCYEKPE